MTAKLHCALTWSKIVAKPTDESIELAILGLEVSDDGFPRY